MTLAAGTRLGPYEIVAPLGAGAMGEVYRARDSRLGRDVAVKVLPEHLANDADLVYRFEEEAKAVAALSHPNILTLHDFGREGYRLYAVMELLEGETLRTRLAHSPPAWSKAVEIAVAIADGLSAAHSRGIIHRDLKPENVFLTSDGRVKILDFGLARWKASPVPDNETSAPTTAKATDPGTSLGTVGYMSPEQVRGDPADVTSDIFSLGCLLYECVAGRRPFQGKTSGETFAAILRDPAPELSTADSAAPRELSRIVSHCLEKEPAERFQSARDLAFALRALEGGAATPRISPTSRRRPIDSIAVLPLVNAGEDSETEYLSEGITETIIMRLSRLPGLRVMARSSVCRYKGPDVDPLAAGRELNVGAVLTGRVLHRGDALVIKTELVDLADGSQLWGERYSRKFADVLEIENEIATQISEHLRITLTGDEKDSLARPSTESTEAYRLYLKGRFYWNKRTGDALRKGIEYFRKAIDADPEYAGAYVGLADSYAVLGYWAILAPADAFPKAKAAALRALEIDPSLSEARTPLAYVNHYYEWNWVEAENEYRRSLEANPRHATTHLYYANLLVSLGRFEEALAQLRLGQEIDPLSLVIQVSFAWCHYYARRYGDAIREARRTLEMDATFAAARWILGVATEHSGAPESAVDELRQAVSLSGGSTMFMAALGHAQVSCGKAAEARATIAEIERISANGYVSPYYLAPIHLALGEKDRCFELLETAFEQRSPGLTFLQLDPHLDGVREDPRFADLAHRVGFPS